VWLIADVRSAPHSRFCPHFNKDALGRALKLAGIDYLFLGDELGARRTEEGCYVDGQARYDRIATLPAFRQGLDAVLAEARQRHVALMCSEADPLTCHRTVLICRELHRLAPDLQIAHILADGGVETQEQAAARLIALHKLEPELFGDLASYEGRVERAFDLQADKIAYTAAATEA
jgi:uncharacterized protein (DUF488 family)